MLGQLNPCLIDWCLMPCLAVFQLSVKSKLDRNVYWMVLYKIYAFGADIGNSTWLTEPYLENVEKKKNSQKLLKWLDLQM